MGDNISQRIQLSDGNTIPLFGLGSWKLSPDVADNSIQYAIEIGYRLFDTAYCYYNEEAVGKTLRESCLKRDEYFIVTKINPDNHGYNEAQLSLKDSLRKLGLDYVDLCLIHSPKAGKNIETWKALIELKKGGLTKSIGVSNFNVQHLEGLLASGLESPVVNQIEFHPWYQAKEAVEFCSKHNIAVMGYCPLARGKMFEDAKYPIIDELSKRYRKTKAQIILRWALQKGVVTIPKTSKVERIKENSDLYDFCLVNEELNEIEKLNQGIHISKASHVMQEAWNG